MGIRGRQGYLYLWWELCWPRFEKRQTLWQRDSSCTSPITESSLSCFSPLLMDFGILKSSTDEKISGVSPRPRELRLEVLVASTASWQSSDIRYTLKPVT